MPHGLPPIGEPDAMILILGTMPSVQSLQKDEYYGNPQNAFWKLLYALWGEEWTPHYPKRTDFVVRHRLALWDVLADCTRKGSADASIGAARPNDFAGFAREHPGLQAVFFNSVNASRLYQKLVHPDPLEHLPQLVLPSSSPARAMTFTDKLAAWQPLKNAWDIAIQKK